MFGRLYGDVSIQPCNDLYIYMYIHIHMYHGYMIIYKYILDISQVHDDTQMIYVVHSDYLPCSGVYLVF